MRPMYNDQELPRGSTINGQRYATTEDTVRLATSTGLPIGFRSVSVMKAGSFATTKVQSITAGGIATLSRAKAERLAEEATVPLN
jgi:hypothetical protein